MVVQIRATYVDSRVRSLWDRRYVHQFDRSILSGETKTRCELIMKVLDIGIFLLVGLSGWNCYQKGFTWSIRGLLSILLGILAANQFWHFPVPVIESFIKNDWMAKWVSIFIIIIGTSIITRLFLERFGQIVEEGVLGWINNILGAAFGIVFSCLLVGTALLLINQLGGKTIEDLVESSVLAPNLMDFSRQFLDFGREVVEEQWD